jgi:hypothetical protein
MTSEITQKYTALVASLRDYIHQEHSKGSWITTNSENYNYFIQLATKKKPTIPSIQAKPPIPLPKSAVKTPEVPLAPPPVSVGLPASPATPLTLESINTTSSSTDPQPKTLFPAPPTEPTTPTKSATNQKHFVRENIPPAQEIDFSDLRSFIHEKFPSVKLEDRIPDDSKAKAIAQNWKAPAAEILILSFSDFPRENALLSNLEIAIKQTLASAKVISANKIELEKGWERLLKAENLRLVIANNNGLQALPELMKYYREDAAGRHTLGNASLHLLPDLSLYMQQPMLKATLWKTLRHQVTKK